MQEIILDSSPWFTDVDDPQKLFFESIENIYESIAEEENVDPQSLLEEEWVKIKFLK